MVRTHATAPRKHSPITLGTELTMGRPNHARFDLPLARITWVKRFIRMLRPITSRAGVVMVVLGLGLALTGCTAPVGTNKRTPSKVYRQTHENALSRSEPSADTLSVLHRFDQVEQFAKSPDATLALIHGKAMESRDRGKLFALS